MNPKKQSLISRLLVESLCRSSQNQGIGLFRFTIMLLQKTYKSPWSQKHGGHHKKIQIVHRHIKLSQTQILLSLVQLTTINGQRTILNMQFLKHLINHMCALEILTDKLLSGRGEEAQFVWGINYFTVISQLLWQAIKAALQNINMKVMMKTT